jgi:alpha-beta hydrolase superfamily lysophospholipase
VSCLANGGNQPALAWAAAANQAGHDGLALAAPPAPDNRCLAYYDPMNFAPDVRCPVLMNAGLIDPVSAPACVWPVYQRLGTKTKQIVPLPGLAHDWSAEFDRRAWRWLDSLGPRSTSAPHQ